MAYSGANVANTYEIRTATDLDRLASAGVITIAADTQLIYENMTDITTSNRFDITAGTLFVNAKGGTKKVTYTGAGTYYTLTGSAGLDQAEVDINGATTATLFDSTTLGNIEIGSSNFTAFKTLGSIVGATILSFRACQFVIWETGLTIDVTNVICDSVPSINLPSPLTAITPFITLSSKAVAPNAQFFSMGNLGVPATLYDIDPAASEGLRVVIQNNSTTGPVFDATGTSGTFTVVADASIGSTSITSVTDNSGVARFNFAGPTVYVDQEVVVSGFVDLPTNAAYNNTGIVTATDGTTWFEMQVVYTIVAFGSSEAVGSFISNSVTLTDTTTTLVNGDRIKLDTDAATDYDSGAVVYNKQTNTVQVNKTWVATATGTWSTNGLDQEDPRVLTALNPGFEDSHYVAAAFVNNNATATGAIVNNTFRDMTFGTGGSALVIGSLTERWKLINEITGVFEYTGNEPFDGFITFDITSLSSGGTVDFRFKWLHDVGAGYVDLPDAVEVVQSIGSTSANASKTFPLSAVKGDRIKPQITRNSGTSGITSQYTTIYASQ